MLRNVVVLCTLMVKWQKCCVPHCIPCTQTTKSSLCAKNETTNVDPRSQLKLTTTTEVLHWYIYIYGGHSYYTRRSRAGASSSNFTSFENSIQQFPTENQQRPKQCETNTKASGTCR